jgi:pimeloyl-ACP methyl ester carboxylesterase
MLTRPRARRLLLKLGYERGELVPAAAVIEILTENAGCTILDEFLRAVWRDGPLADPIDVPGCPIRIAWPVRDRTIPFERYGRPALHTVPAAELVRIDGVGHVPMYDDPRLVARTILEVTQRVDVSAPARSAGAVR